MLALFLWASAALATPAAPAHQIPPLWQGLEPGRFAAGFSVRCAFDSARTFADAESAPGFSARPLRLLVWYPAAAQGDRPGTFADYLDARCADPRFDDYETALAARDRETARRQFSPPSDELLETLRRTASGAARDPSPAPGRFPLLVHSLGRNDYQLESTVLWEFLASHGFVVAVVPQVAEDATRRLAFTPRDLELQAADVAFALAEVSQLPYVDPSRVGLIGHSSGGPASLLLAARSRNIDAVVSLDGSETTLEGAAVLAAADWAPWQVRVPVLELYAVDEENDIEVLASLASAPVYRVGLGTGAPPTQATHFDLQNWPLYSTHTGVEDERGKASRPPELGRDFFLWAVILTGHFLEGTLGERPERLRALTGEEPLAMIPPHLVRYAPAGGRR